MEIWDARYADGSLAGFDLTRGKPIPEGYYHLVVEIILRHRDGSFLLMQRDWSKKDFPGFYEATASGSALKGETSIEAAQRELWEETGIAQADFQQIHRVITEIGAIFIGFLAITDWPKDQIRLQPGETIDYRWISPEEFYEFYQHGPMIPFQRDRLDENFDLVFHHPKLNPQTTNQSSD